MIVANELRSVLASWTDRLIALAVVLIALFALRSSLSDRPFVFAAVAVAALAAVIGAGAARVIQRRLDFHAYDGVVAVDALTRGEHRLYTLSIHGAVCGIMALCVLAGRPATVGLALIGYLVGAGSCNIARRLVLGRGSPRLSAPLRSVRPFLRRPIAGALAAITVVLPVLLLTSIEPGPMAAFIGLVSAVAALLLTMLDDGVVRFMTVSGYRAGRIIWFHSRSVLAFLLLTVPALLALSHGLIAVVVGSVVLAAQVLMTARILAYRVHAKRTADTVVGICTVVACIAGFAMPMLLPFVVMAILWHLHRRAAPATWLLT
ncbi:MAG TPA: hypothetical protein VK980_01215 [Sphingomonas sp.]|nr:hypothetical protein [Sphingomonas sp.]